MTYGIEERDGKRVHVLILHEDEIARFEGGEVVAKDTNKGDIRYAIAVMMRPSGLVEGAEGIDLLTSDVIPNLREYEPRHLDPEDESFDYARYVVVLAEVRKRAREAQRDADYEFLRDTLENVIGDHPIPEPA